MAIYFATFSAVAVSAAQDIWEITAPTGTAVAIREITFGQYSDFGDAQAELISILLRRGHTTTGSGGSTVTPETRTGLSGATAAASVVKANNTTVAASGTAVNLIADTFNVAAGWTYRPLPEERIILQPGVRLVCRITLPTDAITANSTLVFEELGIDPYKPV
jgi:hypothetical protein